MKQITFLAILALATAPVLAQSNGVFFASNYGNWQVAGYAPSAYSFAPATCSLPSPSGGSFVPFATNTPIQIIDANPANNEIVTPTSVVVSGSTCQIAVSPINPHSSFTIRSGTAGLQEAINAANGFAMSVVVITPDFTARGGTTATITSAKGSTNVSILDERTAVFVPYTWNGSAYVAVGGTGGGVPPGTPYRIPSYNPTGNNIQNTNVTIDTTGNVLNAPQYGNLPSSFNVISDGGAICNWNGTTGNDDGPAIQALINAHPGANFSFPMLPAQCNSNENITIGKSHLTGTGSNYLASSTNPTASLMHFAAGLTGFTANGVGASIENMNIIGSAPASQNTADVANLIFPSGSILTEMQYTASFITVTASTITLAINATQPLIPNGIVALSNFPSPYTALNGVEAYIQNSCPNINAPCQISNTGWITIANVYGFATTGRTALASGSIQLGTTGTDAGEGIYVTASGVRLKNLYVASFGRNCIEIDGTHISDDPIITDVWVAGCRMDGYWAHGGDTNAEVLDGFKSYFNQGWGIFDTTFLHGTHGTPQLSYNHQGAQGWSASTPGPAFAVSCTRTSGSVTCTGTGFPFVVGNGIILSSMTDPTLNSQAVINGNTVAVSGFLTAASPTSFTFIQPNWTTVLANTSGTGNVQLGSISQIMTGSAIRGGGYWFDPANAGGNILGLNLYGEGGMGQGDPSGNKCGNEFGGGVILILGHFGDCIDPNFLPGLMLNAGTSGAFISPFNVSNIYGTYNRYFKLGAGFGTDTLSSFLSISDNLGGSGNNYDVGFDFLMTDPGQLDNLYGWRTTFNVSQAGFYNHAFMLGGGGNKMAGATSVPGTVTFHGTGVNDLAAGGTITTSNNSPYMAVVCSTGTPDSFAWYQSPTSDGSGPVALVTINNGGTGFTVLDTSQAKSNDGGNDFFNIQVASVGAGGAVTGINVTSPGLKFVPGIGLALPGAGGVATGPIVTSSVSVPGINYHAGDTGSVFVGTAGTSPALYTIDSVNGSGGVLTYHLTYPGSGGSYSIRTKGTTTITGNGSGFVINITAVSGSGLTLNVITLAGMSACTPMASGANTLSNGLTATWTSTTGHTLADYWIMPITFTAGNHPFVQIPGDMWRGNSGFNKLNWTTRTNNVAPTTRPDGSAAVAGDESFNYNPAAGNGCIFAWTYDGTTWDPVSCGSTVNSVSNSDGTLTISPTTGAVVASIALGHANTWTATQTNSVSWAASTNATLATSGAKVGNNLPFGFSSTASIAGATDTVLCRAGAAGIVSVENAATCTNTVAGGTGTMSMAAIDAGAVNQQAASNTGGTCAMAAGTTCTITLGHTYTTPVCIVTVQSATLTGGVAGCTVSGTTVTITAATANSLTWGALVFGNPN